MQFHGKKIIYSISRVFLLGLFLIFWPAVQCNSGILYLLTFFASLKNYEVRRYPAAKWACTKEYDVDPLIDPMRNWETKV